MVCWTSDISCGAGRALISSWRVWQSSTAWGRRRQTNGDDVLGLVWDLQRLLELEADSLEAEALRKAMNEKGAVWTSV